MPTSDRHGIEAGGATILRLSVRNHPGVMTHVCSLFSRRGFNLEGIACLPVEDGARSLVLLLVKYDERLEQLILQVGKLQDVLAIERAPQAGAVFEILREGWA